MNGSSNITTYAECIGKGCDELAGVFTELIGVSGEDRAVKSAAAALGINGDDRRHERMRARAGLDRLIAAE